MFNSRNREYRDPVGAVESGTAVHFRITLPRDLACSSARLIMEHEGVDTLVCNMFWCGMNGGDKEWWECHYAPEAPGLYFYHFELTTCRGFLRLSRGQGGQATFGGLDRWQMTVFEENFTTPGWLAGGLIYQIFPDRFYASGKPKSNVPTDRKIHENWHDQPDWRPNAEGVVTNSDFFGGDLKGVEEKLPYLKELGVTCIYFNPIFESHSNHRYDTADYSKIDPLLGTEKDFTQLCRAARRYGIRIMLDGVFNHTGSDSIYFNREGRYSTAGAYNSQKSPYAPWYSFSKWPDVYDCWWGFITLPNVNESNPEYLEYINGRNGIIRKWLKAGASGWRLDVADELPDVFLDALTDAAKEENRDAVILGEVWEDASNKSAYSQRRRYLLGGQLDSVMNYPFRDAILGFLLGAPTADCAETIESIAENYPRQCLDLLMNHIGTHDTERALTVLGGEPSGYRGRDWQSVQKLSDAQRELGIKRLKLASAMQYLLPGVPSLYYGDEAGMEGYRDPFNRAGYPWGKENADLLAWYKELGKIRAKYKDVLAHGGYRTVKTSSRSFAFERFSEISGKRLLLLVNRSANYISFSGSGVDPTGGKVIFGAVHPTGEGLPPYSCCLWEFEGK